MVTPSLLGDRYQIIQILERRKLGKTYLATDTRLPSRRQCVVQQFRPILNDPETLDLSQTRFEQEAAILEQLGRETTSIPTVYSYFRTAEAFYLAHEWIDGVSLTETIRTVGMWSQDAVNRFLKSLLPALRDMHGQQVLHQNLAPANILLRKSDSSPVLLNFGTLSAAMAIAQNNQNVPRSIAVGTPGFIPPEQEVGSPVFASDLYSLGLVAIYLLTGKQPQMLETNSRGEILWHDDVADINGDLAIALDTAIRPQLRDRYQTAADLLQVLEQIPESSLSPPKEEYWYDGDREQGDPEADSGRLSVIADASSDLPSPQPSSSLPPPFPIPFQSSSPTLQPQTPNTQAPTPALSPDTTSFQLQTPNTQVLTPALSPDTTEYTRVLLPSESLTKRVKQRLQGFFRTLASLWKKSDPVDCTVFSPAVVSPGITFAVQVFSHRPEQKDLAKAIAIEIAPDATRRGFKSLDIDVKRGSRLTLCLHIPGLEIENPVEYLVWQGRAASVLFDVTVPAEASLGNYIGTLIISHSQIPMGHVKFIIEVGSGNPSPHVAQPLGDATRRYQKAFISYASRDRAEVLKRVQMLAPMKINFFQDVLHLEPGDRWEKELYHHIDSSDLFLLFWSSAAKESRWVMKEVHYAIERKRGNELASPEIVPVIIEGPPPVAPPPELAHLHFNDRLIYFMTHEANPR